MRGEVPVGGEWGAKEETGMPRVLAGIGMLNKR